MIKFTLRTITLAEVVVLFLAALSIQAAPGDLDPTFGIGGKVITTTGFDAVVNGIAIQSDGKIVAVGHHEQPSQSGLVARFNADGSLDQTFGIGGFVTLTAHGGTGGHKTFLMAVAIQPDGKIVTSGHFIEAGGCGPYRGIVFRLNTDGSIDSGFSASGAVEIMYACFGMTAISYANALAIQPNGKIVVAGSSRIEVWPDASMDFAVTRLNADGTFDTSFSGDGMATFAVGAEDDEAFGVAVQPLTGRIVLAGYTENSSGDRDFAVLALSSSGALDYSFGFYGRVMIDFTSQNDQANSVVFQSDGKIIAGGSATSIVFSIPDERFALARFNTNGSLDSTFGSGGKLMTNFSPIADSANAIALQSNGKILAAGVAVNQNTADFAVVRYLSNGKPDTTFSGDGKLTTDFSGGNDRGRAVRIQSNGKIIVAGYASNGSYNDLALARYDP